MRGSNTMHSTKPLIHLWEEVICQSALNKRQQSPYKECTCYPIFPAQSEGNYWTFRGNSTQCDTPRPTSSHTLSNTCQALLTRCAGQDLKKILIKRLHLPKIISLISSTGDEPTYGLRMLAPIAFGYKEVPCDLQNMTQ